MFESLNIEYAVPPDSVVTFFIPSKTAFTFSSLNVFSSIFSSSTPKTSFTCAFISSFDTCVPSELIIDFINVVSIWCPPFTNILIYFAI